MSDTKSKKNKKKASKAEQTTNNDVVVDDDNNNSTPAVTSGKFTPLSEEEYAKYKADFDLSKQRTFEQQFADLDDTKKEAFHEFKRRWEESKQADAPQFTDLRLLHFLRCSPGDVKYNVDAALPVLQRYSELVVEHPWFLTVNIQDVFQSVCKGLSIPSGMRDPDGNRVFYMRQARMAPSDWDLDQFMKFNIYRLNEATQYEDLSTNGASMLSDLSGFGMRHMNMAVMKEFGALTKGAYPMRIRKMYMVNAPRIITVLLKLVRPFMPQEMLDKNVILSKEEYLQMAGPDNVPKELGGNVDVDARLIAWIRWRHEVEGIEYDEQKVIAEMTNSTMVPKPLSMTFIKQQ